MLYLNPNHHHHPHVSALNTTMIYTTKKELAQAYCPDIDHTAALKKLNHWIRTNTELSARLFKIGRAHV